jgi:hypothetical protein
MRLLALKKKMTTKGDLLGHCQQVLLRKLVNLFWCCSRVEEASFLSFLKHNDEKKKMAFIATRLSLLPTCLSLQYTTHVIRID